MSTLFQNILVYCLFALYFYELGTRYVNNLVTADDTNLFSAIGFAAYIFTVVSFPALIKGQRNSLTIFLISLTSPAIIGIMPFALSGRFASDYLYTTVIVCTFAFGFWILFKSEKSPEQHSRQIETRRTVGYWAFAIYVTQSLTLHADAFIVDGSVNEFSLLGLTLLVFSLVSFIYSFKKIRFTYTIFLLSVVFQSIPYIAVDILVNKSISAPSILTAFIYLALFLVFWFTLKPENAGSTQNNTDVEQISDNNTLSSTRSNKHLTKNKRFITLQIITYSVSVIIFVLYFTSAAGGVPIRNLPSNDISLYIIMIYISYFASIAIFPSAFRHKQRYIAIFLFSVASPSIFINLHLENANQLTIPILSQILSYVSFAIVFHIAFKMNNAVSKSMTSNRQENVTRCEGRSNNSLIRSLNQKAARHLTAIKISGYIAFAYYCERSIRIYSSYSYAGLNPEQLSEQGIKSFIITNIQHVGPISFALALFVFPFMIAERKNAHLFFAFCVVLPSLIFGFFFIHLDMLDKNFLISVLFLPILATTLWATFKPLKHQTAQSTIPQ